MKTTVYCYDRYATFKRIGAAALLVLGAGAALALTARSAEAAPAVKIERLPTVVITGKAVKPVQLPRVVVEGRRQAPATMMAAEERATAMPELKQVAYAPKAAGY